MDAILERQPEWSEQAPEHGNGVLRNGIIWGPRKSPSFCAVTLDGTKMMTLQRKHTGQPKVYRCRYCNRTVHVNGTLQCKPDCPIGEKWGRPHAEEAVTKWAIVMAIFETGNRADDRYDRRLEVSWRRWMRQAEVLPTELNWDEQDAFLQYATKRLDNEKLGKMKADAMVAMGEVRRLNMTSIMFSNLPPPPPVQADQPASPPAVLEPVVDEIPPEDDGEQVDEVLQQGGRGEPAIAQPEAEVAAVSDPEVAPNVNETVEAIPGEQDAAMDVDGMANQPPDCDVVVDGAPEMIPDVDEASAELADEGSVSGEPDTAADHDGGRAGEAREPLPEEHVD